MGGEDSDDELEEDLEGQEGMDVDTVGMVPMADMLNALWGSENVSFIVTCEGFDDGTELMALPPAPPSLNCSSPKRT